MLSKQPFSWIAILGLIMSMSCTLIAEGTLTDDQRLVRDDRPALLLLAPITNSNYASGTTVTLHALVQDSVGVSRVDFMIEAAGLEEVITVNVDNPQPDTPLNAIVRWQPPIQDLYILEVRAFRAAGDATDPGDDISSNVAIRTFEVVPRPDNVVSVLPNASPPSNNNMPDLPTISAIVNSSANVPIRQGPSPDYALVETANPGVRLDIAGRSLDSIWLVVSLPTGLGWIIADAVTLAGDIASLPPVEAPPLNP